MTRMSTIYSRLSYGSGTTLAGCGVSAKAYAETAKTAKEVSWMLADRIAGLSLSDWAIIVGTRDNYQPAVPLNQPKVLDRAAAPATQRSELKVTFDNAPQGMRVTDIPSSSNPLMNISHDVGYSPFKIPR